MSILTDFANFDVWSFNTLFDFSMWTINNIITFPPGFEKIGHLMGDMLTLFITAVVLYILSIFLRVILMVHREI